MKLDRSARRWRPALTLRWTRLGPQDWPWLDSRLVQLPTGKRDFAYQTVNRIDSPVS
jgi:hypothetical protein